MSIGKCNKCGYHGDGGSEPCIICSLQAENAELKRRVEEADLTIPERLQEDYNPSDAEDCEACLIIRDWPCPLHQMEIEKELRASLASKSAAIEKIEIMSVPHDHLTLETLRIHLAEINSIAKEALTPAPSEKAKDTEYCPFPGCAWCNSKYDKPPATERDEALDNNEQ